MEASYHHPHEHHHAEHQAPASRMKNASPEEMKPHEGHAHDGHDHAKMIDDFKKRFYVSLAITIPVLLLSRMIQDWLGFSFTLPLNNYILFLLSSVIFFYGGLPFLKGLADE